MITVAEHLERILNSTPCLESERVPLTKARDRCLADPVQATLPVPPWTNSAMDGYAVRHRDIAQASESAPISLKVVADIPAGSRANPIVGPGEAARIMTGAPLPETADTVVPQELTDLGENVVQIKGSLEPGRHVRYAGEDRKVDELLVAAGIGLTPESLAAIASAGHGSVRVSKQPRITVISTGDELVAPGSALTRGQIPDSNALLLSFLSVENGATATTDHAGDSPGELAAVMDRHAEDSDLLVLTGGVSVGAYDPVKQAFEQSDSVRFDRVAMQPGKPQAFGRLGKQGPLIFGLPGNPISAWVSFQMFVRPALRKMQGFSQLMSEPVPARAVEDWKTPAGRAQVIPVRIRDGGERQVLPAATGGSGSHLIASLAAADGYALVPSERESVQAGEMVDTVRLRDPEQFNHQQRSLS